MCIRDRILGKTENISEYLSLRIGAKGSRIQFKSCLLYTSDAADDLLCVDLGGRRIIKKKKLDAQICKGYNNDRARLVSSSTYVYVVGNYIPFKEK